jgi:hypothetical protein
VTGPEPGSPAALAARAAAAAAPVDGGPGPTGHPGVDATLAVLAESDDLPPAQRVGAFEQAHRALSQTLAAIDQG